MRKSVYVIGDRFFSSVWSAGGPCAFTEASICVDMKTTPMGWAAVHGLNYGERDNFREKGLQRWLSISGQRPQPSPKTATRAPAEVHQAGQAGAIPVVRHLGMVRPQHVSARRRSETAAMSDAADRFAQALRDLINEAMQAAVAEERSTPPPLRRRRDDAR